MAYQAPVAIEKIVIKQTEQIARQSDQGQDIRLQLLDTLDRLESIERRFQVPYWVSESGRQLNSGRNAGNPEAPG